MGALYWQLNDVWPSVSWSSLDHALAWKTLHHHAKRFFAPVALSARIEAGKLLVFGLSDRHEAAPIDIRVRRLDLDGKVLDETTATASLSPDHPVALATIPAPPGPGSFFVIDARVGGASSFDPLLRFTVFTDKPKRYDFPAATVTAAAVGGKPGTFTLSADRPAFFVKPEASEFDGAFDDASFLLLPGEPRTVAFRSFDGRQPEAKDLTLLHLAETYR
jgi:beta-mannosidase